MGRKVLTADWFALDDGAMLNFPCTVLDRINHFEETREKWRALPPVLQCEKFLSVAGKLEVV